MKVEILGLVFGRLEKRARYSTASGSELVTGAHQFVTARRSVPTIHFPFHATTSGLDAARHNRIGLWTAALASVLPSGEKATELT